MTSILTRRFLGVVALAVGFLAALDVQAAFEPILNEILASNDTGLADEDGEFSDWIEIRNDGDAAGNLKGWFLTDDFGDLRGWEFPPTHLNPGDFVIVFASGKNRQDSGQELHANFKLSSGGEYLALVRPDETTVVAAFTPSYPGQLTDQSYGIETGTGSAVYFQSPTPGLANSVALALAGPTIVMVTEGVPPHPSTADLAISAEIIPAAGRTLVSAELVYRVDYGGEISVALLDNGQAPDDAVGDGVFSASIPSAAFESGDMVRWVVQAADSEGAGSSVPARLDPLAAEYFGTVVDDALTTAGARRFRWWVEDERWYFTNDSLPIHKEYTNCSVFFDGEFYDNVRVRTRGASSVLLNAPVQSFHFNFDRSHRFKYFPDFKRIDRINLNWMFVDQVYLRNQLSMEVFAAAGVVTPSSEMVVVHQNGSYHNVGNLIEHPDEYFLERHGLSPTGALYKVYNRLEDGTERPGWTPGVSPNSLVGVEKKTRLDERNNDIWSFTTRIDDSNSVRLRYLMDNVNIPAVLNYMAAGVIDQAHDVFTKNNFAYRDTEGSREWQLFPWDRDVSWGQGVWNQNPIVWSDPIGSHPYYGSGINGAPTKDRFEIFEAIIDEPILREMFQRRLRTVLDEQLQPPGTPRNELLLEARIAELLASLGRSDLPPAQADHWIQRDKDLYGKLRGSPGQSGYSATTALQSLQVAADALTNTYLPNRRDYLYNTMGSSGAGIVLDAQVGRPAMEFGALEYNPVSENQDEEFIEIVNPNAFAVDISGWTVTGGIQHTFHPGTVLPAAGDATDPDRGVLHLSPSSRDFRLRATSPTQNEERFVQGNYQGHLSNWGETLELRCADGTLMDTLVTPVDPSDAQRFLVVSEVMYHPELDGLAEYIELLNIGPDTLDLSSVNFTAGIAFDFSGSAITSLASGERVLVVRDLVAFESAHGEGLPVAGEFANLSALGNLGEMIKLEDSTNSTIVEFRYRDDFPWPVDSDGNGFSLVLIDPASRPDPGEVANWRSSIARGGTPGSTDASSFAGDPAGDQNGDGNTDYLHYATTGDLSVYFEPLVSIVTVDPGNGNPPVQHVAFTYRRNLAADDVFHEVEISQDLLNWEPGGTTMVPFFESNNGDGTSSVTCRAVAPLTSEASVFVRLMVQAK
jgi:hypothetical protein